MILVPLLRFELRELFLLREATLPKFVHRGKSIMILAYPEGFEPSSQGFGDLHLAVRTRAYFIS